MCRAQGVIGETYNRMLVGEAVHDPNSQYYLPDDYTFHGKGTEEDYVVDGLFGETANTMFGKVDHPSHPLTTACGLQRAPCLMCCDQMAFTHTLCSGLESRNS